MFDEKNVVSALQPRRQPGSRDLGERKNAVEAVITTTTSKIICAIFDATTTFQ